MYILLNCICDGCGGVVGRFLGGWLGDAAENFVEKAENLTLRESRI